MRTWEDGKRQGKNIKKSSRSHPRMSMCEGVLKESLHKGKRDDIPFHMEKASEVQSMLVIHQGALGDFILSLPVLETLRKTFPMAKSVIMGYQRILELVKGRFYAEEILSIDQKGMASFFVPDGQLDLTLSHFLNTFDLMVVFGKNGEGNLIGNLKRVCRGDILPIQPFLTWGEDIHLTDHLLRQLARYGFPISDSDPRLYLRESDQEWGKDFWKRRGFGEEERSRVIVIHPGSGSRKKVWPLVRFLELVNHLQAHQDLKPLIVLGPAEGAEVQKAFEEMRSSAPILAKGLSLIQLASVMKGCRLFIGNDSGISHMAASLGLPVVVIFGPTNPKVWSPRGERVRVVRLGIPCSPCPQEKFFQCKDFECMKGIEIKEVLQAFESMDIKV
jgi:ADP-heptose:LPS heptosyltransferase